MLLPFLKKIFGGRIHERMQDPKKVRAVIDELNNLGGPGKGYWVEAQGYHALTAMEIKGNRLSAIPNSATPLKVFVNRKTGELRTYVSPVFDNEFDNVSIAPASTNPETEPAPSLINE